MDRDLDFVAGELRPGGFDELGLVKVLDTYVHEWSRHAGIAAVFSARPAILERFAQDVEISIYRIAQEALNNVARHSHARSVNVLLELRGHTLALLVEDDGIGFQRGAAGETTIGLTGMRDRLLAMGGSLEIQPTPGGGTTLVASLPTTSRRSGAIESGESNDPALGDIPAQLQELQRAVAARDEFIATVAHELRNPIAPLTFQVRLALNGAERMAASGSPVSIEWVQSQLHGIEKRLDRLLETLDRLLDVSRLSSGRIDLQTAPMRLGDVVREVIDAFEAELAVARCPLTFTERGDASGVWDRLRVEQVCRNLLSNAIRFGAGRPIEVTVDADDGMASLCVRDHGVGIAPGQHTKIFERFERGVEQRSGGFGIGLWIVRNICAAMEGTVSVESTLGQGACFTVRLPRATPGEAAGLHRSTPT